MEDVLQWPAIDDAARADQLDLIATEIKSNLDAIKTWNSTFSFQDSFRFDGDLSDAGESGEATIELNAGVFQVGDEAGGGYWEITTGDISFVVDAEKSSFHLFYQPLYPVGLIEVATGKQSQWSTFGDPIHAVVTPDYAYEFYSDLEHAQLDEFPALESLDRSGGRVLTKQAVEDNTQSFRAISPWEFFSNGSQPFWENARLYADAIRDGKVTRTKVRKSPDSTGRFAMVAYYTSGRIGVTVYDSRYGFNPTHWFLKFGENDSSIGDSRVFEYQKEAEIHVPSKCVIVSTSEFEGKRMMSKRRKFELRETSVN